MQKAQSFGLIAVLLSIGLHAGCGANKDLVPVAGRVLLDGKAIEGAAVLFEPDSGGVPATGVTGSNGDFVLETTGQGKGATVGKYSVSVAKSVNVQPGRKIEEGEIVPMKMETPVQYASPKSSGISIEVKPGMDPVELLLKSKN